MKNKTILLGLNELNFDFVKYYITKGELQNFKRLFEIQPPIISSSEKEYKLLEPWIQWVSIYTGLSFKEHGVFRLGDIVEKPELSQLFEELESKGINVGTVSPFNADNRLKSPAFFVPDPWTVTKLSGSRLVEKVYKSIRQLVNDNAQSKVSLSSLLNLGIGFLVFIPIRKWASYFKRILNFKKPGMKAIILDMLLADIFIQLFGKSNTDFGHLFLNSAAHVQHHYLFNSDAYAGDLKNPEWYCPKGYDPLIQILRGYDQIIGELLSDKSTKLIVATGLHQVPHESLTFYWRLKNHAEFLNEIGLNSYKEVIPRMSRDFLVQFGSIEDANTAEKLLLSFKGSSDDSQVFTVDNRGESLFVELVWSKDIKVTDYIYSDDRDIKVDSFKNYTAFVAIKNGEHHGDGYLTGNYPLDLPNNIELTQVKDFLIKEVMSSSSNKVLV